MKQTLFFLAMLLQPLFSRAGDPIPCRCATDSVGLDKIGLLVQYHEMMSALDQADQKMAKEKLVEIFELNLYKSAAQGTPDSVKTKLLLLYCEAIAGQKATVFRTRADSLGLLKNGKALLAPANPDFYKARLACLAVQARGDTLAAVSDGRATPNAAAGPPGEEARLWQYLFLGTGLGMLIFLGLSLFLWLGMKKERASAEKTLAYWQALNQGLKEEKKRLENREEGRIKIREKEPEAPPAAAETPADGFFAAPPPDPLAPGFFEGTATDSAESFAPAAPPPAPVEPQKIFARLPNGRLLYSVSDSFEPQSTYFVIEVGADQRSGTLKLVGDENTRLHAFSMIDRLRDACELQSTGAPTSAWVDETPGRVELEGGYWNITRKITLQW